MVRRIGFGVSSVFVFVLAALWPLQGWAFPLIAAPPGAYSGTIDQAWLPGVYYSLGLKKFLNSFTSYQFPNPFPPNQDPLSRLEFPIDQWFLGGSANQVTSIFSLSGNYWVNVNRESALKMQDSDWTDDAMTSQKTIFSESKCRLNKALLAEAQVSAAISHETASIFRPVVGWRYQYFFFTTHDGYQSELGGVAVDLPGDGIEFTQIFNHYYVGAMANTTVDLGAFISSLPRIRIEAQADYGMVVAKNQDLHLLRDGERYTIERTRGHCWHVYLCAALLSARNATARIEADFKRVLTNGGHQLTNSAFALDFSFDGANVWSDQASVAAVGEVRF